MVMDSLSMVCSAMDCSAMDASAMGSSVMGSDGRLDGNGMMAN